MTRIGVVIPTHRFDHWLDEAVTSVLGSERVDFRVVVVANGIPETTPRTWCEDPRVALLHSVEPLGPSGAMLPGIAELDTEFVARLDADDRMHPRRLLLQSTFLDAHPETPLVGTATRRITESSTPAGPIRMPTGEDIRQHLVLSNTLVHSSFLMRRADLDAVGGYNPAHLQMEDYDLALRLALRGPIAVLPQELTDYRIHASQTSRGAAPRGEHIDRVLALRNQLGAALGMSRTAVAARNALWRTVQYTRYYGITRPGHRY